MTTKSLGRFHHSSIECENGVIRKLIEPDFPFTPGGKESLLLDITMFRKKLKEMDIPLADRYDLKICKRGIEEETMNCGVDGYSLLRSGRVEILNHIVRAILPILLQEEICVVPDPHPANWCFDAKGNIRYVDFQPPRFLKADGTRLVGFPQPVGKEYKWSVARYYSRFALFRILRFNTMRAVGHSITKTLKQAMKAECSDALFRELYLKVEALPEYKVRKGLESLENALEKCDEWHVDDIRELAMFVSTHLQTGSANFLGKVLELTRVDFNLTIEERRKRVETAKNLILNQGR